MRAISSSLSVIGTVRGDARIMSFVNVPRVVSRTFFAPGPKAKTSPSSVKPVDVGDGDGSPPPWPAQPASVSTASVAATASARRFI